ncbi:MAG TPA: DUF2382 domain-containing protein [Thermomicrobiaceae bacterium]|nr:DUF2382 domain-containing protein [Thermomicrobiaceae bacterium]
MIWQEPDERGQPAAGRPRITPGSTVYTADGVTVGTIVSERPTYVEVASGSIFPASRYIPVAAVARVTPDAVYLNLTNTEIATQPWGVMPGAEEPPAGEERLAPDGLAGGPGTDLRDAPITNEGEQVLELREERLVARKELREVGEIGVRVEVEELPGRLAIDAAREEVEVEHLPVGQVVSERRPPWQEGDVLIVPVYEEQLVVVKRLVLREQLRIRRVSVTERRLFEDQLRRERVVVDDPDETGLVHEQYATAGDAGSTATDADDDTSLGARVKKMFS